MDFYNLFLKSDGTYQGSGVDMEPYKTLAGIGITAAPLPPEYGQEDDMRIPIFTAGEMHMEGDIPVYDGTWSFPE